MKLNKETVLLLMLSIISFSSGAAMNPKMIPTVSGEGYSQDNTNIVVNPKQPTFVIRLKSNPTTGYSWFLREYNSRLLTPLGHEFEGSSDRKLIGAPGVEKWTFKLKPDAFTVPQQTQIRFVYSRPWAAMENTTQVVFRVSTSSK